MGKIFAAIMLCLAISACGKDPAENKSTDNTNFTASRLFTVDGCSVYRFTDASRYVYFTTCSGGTFRSETEHYGKYTSEEPFNVPTATRP